MQMAKPMKNQNFPRGMKVKMTYSSSFDLDDTLAGYKEHVFRLNGLHDPDVTGTGHQPLGYDQWSAIYKAYFVYAAKFEAWFGGDESATVPFSCGMAISQAATLIGSMDTIIEMPGSQWGKVGLSSAGAAPLHLTIPFTKIADVGGRKAINMEKDWGANFYTDPVEEVLVHLAAETTDSNNLAVDVRVRITYYCWVYDPLDLAAS